MEEQQFILLDPTPLFQKPIDSDPDVSYLAHPSISPCCFFRFLGLFDVILISYLSPLDGAGSNPASPSSNGTSSHRPAPSGCIVLEEDGLGSEE
jgi:hypothetical protein